MLRNTLKHFKILYFNLTPTRFSLLRNYLRHLIRKSSYVEFWAESRRSALACFVRDNFLAREKIIQSRKRREITCATRKRNKKKYSAESKAEQPPCLHSGSDSGNEFEKDNVNVLDRFWNFPPFSVLFTIKKICNFLMH